eukprot:1194781-Prorocentrum_minimum.AAC.1
MAQGTRRAHDLPHSARQLFAWCVCVSLFLLAPPAHALKRKTRPELPDVDVEVLETSKRCTRRAQTGDSLSLHYVGYLRDGRQVGPQ